jgi:hypothetical protein
MFFVSAGIIAGQYYQSQQIHGHGDGKYFMETEHGANVMKLG